MNQIYNYQSVFYEHNKQITKFVFIGYVEFNEHLNYILSELEKQNYAILDEDDKEDINNFEYIEFYLNLSKQFTKTKFINDLKHNISKETKIFFIRDFLFEWETIESIKQKIFIHCHNKIHLLFDFPFFTITINDFLKPNSSKYLYNYLHKNNTQHNVITIITLFDELLLKKIKFDFDKDTIQLPKLNQKKLMILI